MKYIMKAKLFLVCLAVSFVCFTAPLFGQKRIVDNAGRLTEAEEAKLEAIAARIASSYNFNFMIVTESRENAGEYYDWKRYASKLYNNYGFSDKIDGCLLLAVENWGACYFTPGRGENLSRTRALGGLGSRGNYDLEYYYTTLNAAFLHFLEGIEKILPLVPYYGKDRLVVDNAICMNEDKITEFEAIARGLASSYKFNFILVTEWDTASAAPEEYAKNRYNSYGFGEDSDGFLLLYVSGPGRGEYHLYTSGRGTEIYKSTYFKKVKDKYDYNIKYSSLYSIFSDLAKGIEEVLSYPPPKNDRRFIDGLGRLSNAEAAKLEAIAGNLASSYGFNFAIVTEYSMGDSMIGRKRNDPQFGRNYKVERGGSKLEDYAENLYKRYGFDSGSDACLFYYLMEIGEYCFITSGRGANIVNSIMFKQLEEGLIKKLEARDFYEAYFALADGLEKIVSASASASVPIAASGSASASQYGKNRLVASAGILSAGEAQNLKETLDRISETYKFDIVILANNSIGGAEPQDYAKEYYNLMGYGIGEEKDGCLFLHVTGSREYWFTTSGRAKNIFFSGNAYSKMMTDFHKNIENNNYNDAYLSIADNCEKFLALDAKGKTFHYSFFKLYYYLFIAAAIGLAAGWFAGRPKRR